jgi:RNA polymerase sigma factor (sigma-70 family)
MGHRDIFDDLLGAARLGLVVAARTFDPERGVQFRTHAWWPISREVRQVITDDMLTHGWKRDSQTQKLYQVRPSDELLQDATQEKDTLNLERKVLYMRAAKTRREAQVAATLLAGWTPTQIAKQLGMSPGNVWLISNTLRDRTQKKAQGLLTTRERRALAEGQRRKEVLSLRRAGHTFKAIGRRVGITSARAHQICRAS